MSIYREPEYIKNRLVIEDPMESKKERKETIAAIREKIAAMSTREKRGLKPAAIEKALKKIEEQIGE